MASTDSNNFERGRGGPRTWDFGRDDHPPFSRIFVVHAKGVTEADFRESFEKYGEIQDVWIVKDRRTGMDKGVTYIKFRKTSQAALAMEEMNGKFLKDNPRPIKVLLANSRHEGSGRDPNEDVKMLRLFLMVPKHYTEDDVREKFTEYGKLDSVLIVRDRETRNSKGFAYVKYFRAHHAALALESCDPTFKPIFAEPKGVKRDRDTRDRNDRGGGRDSRGEYPSGGGGGYRDDYRGGGATSMGRMNDGPMDMIQNFGLGAGSCHLEGLVSALDVTRQQLQSLFDLCPGLDYFEYNSRRGIVYASYVSPQCAAYALQKLNGFEYPPNYQISVRYAESSNSGGMGAGNNMDQSQILQMLTQLTNTMQTQGGGGMGGGGLGGGGGGNNVAGMLQNMTSMLNRSSGGGGIGGVGGGYMNSGGMGGTGGNYSNSSSNAELYCDFLLPPQQPRAPRDSPVQESLFVVMSPRAVNDKILIDAFQRFGNLIEIYMVPGKNYGYARYSEKDSAMKAMDCLHQRTIDGQYVKVIIADPPRRSGASRVNPRERSPSPKRGRKSESWD
ncbi:RNA-binding protein 45-like isoform X2 [Tubulanus polymorphus]|uniref:RNA-binding protein 45-like isoform X2 n=1 Tax=Tubulanus polymorphus TaxID=672921 RepID=UPI003DA65063